MTVEDKCKITLAENGTRRLSQWLKTLADDRRNLGDDSQAEFFDSLLDEARRANEALNLIDRELA